jgi:hypothetical protein
LSGYLEKLTQNKKEKVMKYPQKKIIYIYILASYIFSLIFSIKEFYEPQGNGEHYKQFCVFKNVIFSISRYSENRQFSLPAEARLKVALI